MSTITFAAAPARISADRLADSALKSMAAFWFVTAVASQLILAISIALFYGSTTARGALWAWNSHMLHGRVTGDTMGNAVVATHLLAAVIMILGGAIQFVPRIRARFPVVHRWSGRLYVLSAAALSGAGVYMLWVRGSIVDTASSWGFTLDAVAIWICAAMAVRYAIARDFRTHRQWALRLFLVASGSWFSRVGIFLTFLIFQRPVGFDPVTFTGWFITFVSYAMFLVPLAVAELYFLAQRRPGAVRRLAMAATLFVLTMATAAGTFGVAAARWIPDIRDALDTRKSIATALETTIASNGIDAAVRQYRALKGHKDWNFGEDQLNVLGRQFLRAGQVPEAIRLFALNAETFPNSSAAQNSLGDGYVKAENRVLAVASYRKALQLNPKSLKARAELQKLGAL